MVLTSVRFVGKPPEFSLANRDAVAWLRSLDDASIDLVITDPPYESLEKHRAIGTTTRLKNSKASSNDWFQIFPNARFAELFVEINRVLKKNRHFYMFCDQETAFYAKPVAEQCGFKFWKPLVWDKKKIGMGYHYRARYEFILFFEKGKRKLNNLGQADIIEAPRVFRGYPAEKNPSPYPRYSSIKAPCPASSSPTHSADREASESQPFVAAVHSRAMTSATRRLT